MSGSGVGLPIPWGVLKRTPAGTGFFELFGLPCLGDDRVMEAAKYKTPWLSIRVGFEPLQPAILSAVHNHRHTRSVFFFSFLIIV